jgi:DNA-directed RNA polymerase specialized sigma24 family protein
MPTQRSFCAPSDSPNPRDELVQTLGTLQETVPPCLKATAIRLELNGADADDAWQEAVTAALVTDTLVSDWPSWLFAVGRKKLLDAANRNSKTEPINGVEPAVPRPPDLEANERFAALEAAFRRAVYLLQGEDRRLAVMSMIWKRKGVDVARRLDKCAGQISKRLKAVRGKIAGHMDQTLRRYGIDPEEYER